MTTTNAEAVSARQRLGISHLGPGDLRFLTHPEDSAACKVVRNMPVTMGWITSIEPDPNVEARVDRGYFRVGNVYLVSAVSKMFYTSPGGAEMVYIGPDDSDVGVVSLDGRDLGIIDW